MRVARWCRLPLVATVLGLVVAGPAHAQYPAPVEYLPPGQYQGPAPYQGAAPYQGPAEHRAPTQAEEVLFSVLATATNLFYTPLKFAIALVAMPAGGFAGAASGGDARTAYAIWVPAFGGTFFLTAAHMEGTKPIEFWGSDYADQPLPTRKGQEESLIFDDAATGVYSNSATTAAYGTGPTQVYGSTYR
jgi:hypothetical protein